MANADASTTGAADLDSDDVVTVTTLNDEIADVIEDKSDIDHQYVVGDVSDCRESNRHLHFDLMSEEASIHCVVF
jgi:exodeoxyribonuclease VII large subunit